MNKLSICIPSYRSLDVLNDLLDSIEAILLESGDRESVEICVFYNGNNLSVCTPSKIDRYGYSFKKLGIDNSMHQAILLATNPYIWMLGDDDKDKVSALPKIMETIYRNNPDLILVHSLLDSRPESLEKTELITPTKFLLKYWDKLSFGSFVSKSIFIQNNTLFFNFYNSKHAYAGVILSSISKKDVLEVSTFFYNEAKTFSEKTYQQEHTLVHLLDIPYFFSKLKNFYPYEIDKVIDLYYKQYFKFGSLLRWIINLDFKIIFDERLNRVLRLKLFFVILLKKIYSIIRSIYSRFPKERDHCL
jgi:hypothetical protein